MVATGVELFFIAQKRVFVNSVDCPETQILFKSRIKMSPNRQRLGFTFKGTDLSSTGGHTYCLSLRDGNKV